MQGRKLKFPFIYINLDCDKLLLYLVNRKKLINIDLENCFVTIISFIFTLKKREYTWENFLKNSPSIFLLSYKNQNQGKISFVYIMKKGYIGLS